MTTGDPRPAAARADRPAGPELARVHDALFAARHQETDVDWADRAFVHMGFADVRLDQAELLLTEAADTVRDAQESPQDLFGDPTDWADQRIRDMRESGLDVFEDALLMGPREAIIASFGLAAGMSALFFLSQLLDLVLGTETGPSPLTPGFALAPLLISGAIILLITVFKRATPRHPFPVAIGLCAVVLVLCGAGIASIIMPLGQSDLRAGWLWSTLLVPAYAALAWVISKLWPAPAASGPAPLTAQQILDSAEIDDDVWLQRARAALRHRGDLTDARIDADLAEARAHAADSGSGLLQEFGSPEGYAQTLPADRLTVPRRLTLFYAVLALAWAVLALVNAADAHWSLTWSIGPPAILTVVFAIQALRGARRWRRAAQRSARPSI
jgi:hypothetical protein